MIPNRARRANLARKQQKKKKDQQRAEKLAKQAAAKKAAAQKKKQEEEEEPYSEDEDVDDDETVGYEDKAEEKAGTTSRKRKSEDLDGDEDHQDSQDDLKKQILRLQMENKRLQIVTKPGRSKGGAKAKSSKKTAMQKEVIRVAKGELWHRCKHIRNEAFLNKATRFVLKNLDLPEMEGLQGDSLRQAQDLWVEEHQDAVREAINARRSYVLGEVHDYMVEQMIEGKMADLPDPESILRIAMREGLNEGTPAQVAKMQELAVIYWDALLPKICGVDYWSPPNATVV